MTENDIKIVKEKYLDAIQVLDTLCEQNGIRYFACGGTAIGAVRHKGFIPWDDDMDVYMLREDYDVFLGLKNKVNGKYKIVDYHDEGYFLPYAKLIDTSVSYWAVEEYQYNLGVSIDVFPLDYVDGSEEEAEKLSDEIKKSFLRYKRTLSTQSISTFLKLLVNFRLRTALDYIETFFILKPRRNKLLADFEKKYNVIKKKRGEKVLMYFAYYNARKEIQRREVFSNQVTMPFESINIKLPSGYDEYLRKLYGDYMQLPPKEKQKTHHIYFYFNAKEGLSIQEMKNRRKQKKK